MHPRTNELLDHLAAQRGVLRAAVVAVPIDRHNRAPAPGRWSVTEVLQHLAQVESRVARLLRTQLDVAIAEGLPSDASTAPVVPTIDRAALLDRERRFRAPTATPFDPVLPTPAAWSLLDKSRERLQGVVVAADGLAVASIVAAHPFLGELDFHQWVVFVGYHEARHADQVREIGASLV